ncbi:transcription factor A, mitochondrial-like [Diadema setosum]|uniref:transcription factor A, mitochondrial-like n=1 Tax=Diadema setosum TaxID=31175 RepID=UPI003B3B244F
MAISMGVLFRTFSQKCKIVHASARQGLLGSSTCLPSCPRIQHYQTISDDIPPKPKRPLSSFFLFVVEQRPKILAEEPDLRNTEVVKRIAAMWKEMSDSEKEVYRQEFESQRIKFQEEMEDFRSRLTDEQLDTLMEMSRKKREMRSKRRHRAELRKLNKPKRPPSGYSLFVKEHLSSTLRPGGARTTEEKQAMFKDAAEAWNAIPDYEKQRYNEEANQLLETYKEEMNDWKRRMEEEGTQV